MPGSLEECELELDKHEVRITCLVLLRSVSWSLINIRWG